MRNILPTLLIMLFSTISSLSAQPERDIDLPEPRKDSELSVEAVLAERRSHRDFKKEPLRLSEVGQLLWAAQGITSSGGKRTAPSAGALYPLEIFVVAGKVEGLSPGVYQYRPHNHKLRREKSGDLRRDLAVQAVQQMWISDAPVVIVIAAVFQRTTSKYGERGERYVHMEVGYASQNIYLQAEALKIGACAVGAFQDGGVQELLDMRNNEHPLLLMPVGRE